MAAASRVDPPIQVDSIVTIKGAGAHRGYIGIVVWHGTFDPGFRNIQLPGIGTVEAALESCYNATEAERKQYFKLALKYGT